jgi:uncharacterized protein (TIRG00374 family)
MRTRFVLTALLAFALLLWLLKSVNLVEVWTHVRSADRAALAGGVVFVVLTYVARAIRWQYLLAPIGPTRFRTAFRTTIIGFAVLTLLPLRVGDLLRPYLLARREGLRASAVLATVAMERILDLMAVLILLAIFLWSPSDIASLPPDAGAALTMLRRWGGILGALSVVAIGLMWVLATHPQRLASLVMTVERVVSPRIAHAVARYVSFFSTGFAATRSPAALARAVFWSMGVWLAVAAETWIVARGFGINMSFVGSFVMQPLLVLGVAVGTPGGLGPYQWAYVFGVTTFFGATQETAVAASFVVWVIGFIPVVLVGLIYMAQDGLTMGRLEQMASEARGKEPPSTDEVPILRSSRR